MPMPAAEANLSPNLAMEHDRWIMFLANTPRVHQGTGAASGGVSPARPEPLWGAQAHPDRLPAYVRDSARAAGADRPDRRRGRIRLPLFDHAESRDYWDNACRMMEARLRLREAPRS